MPVARSRPGLHSQLASPRPRGPRALVRGATAWRSATNQRLRTSSWVEAAIVMTSLTSSGGTFSSSRVLCR